MFRPRLHKSSIFVGLSVALLLVLIEIPGRVVGGRGGGNRWTVFEHGWPWIYLRRETVEYTQPTVDTTPDGRQFWFGHSLVFNPPDPRSAPRWGIPWLSAENWLLWEADTSAVPPHWDFNPVTLACDLAIALSVLAGAIAVWEFWRRRRAKVLHFRFGLRSLLLSTAFAGGALGWLRYLGREHTRETRIIEKEFERSGPPMDDTWNDSDHVCVAPLWLRSLVGVRLWPEYFWRASAVTIAPERGDKTDLMCAEIAQLDYVSKIAIDGHPRRHFRFSALRGLQRLETLEIWTHPIIDDEDVNELTHLKQLRKIVIEDLDEITPDQLTRLKTALPNCRIIYYLDDW